MSTNRMAAAISNLLSIPEIRGDCVLPPLLFSTDETDGIPDNFPQPWFGDPALPPQGVLKSAGVDMAAPGTKDKTVSAPIERRHVLLDLWLQNVKKPRYPVDLLEHFMRGGIITIPSSLKEIDTYSRHVISLKGILGPCQMWYEGVVPVRMLIAVDGFCIIGGLRPASAHALTGTHVKGYRLRIAEVPGMVIQWGQPGDDGL